MKHQIEDLIGALNGVLLGKETQIKLSLACLFARGHLLIEDLPGMGKTLLAHALAKVLGLSYNRIQFTSDVLPSDIIGATIFDRELNNFRFVEGPLFAQLVLADEINRATPKSQSALLEAMEERQVTNDGQSRPLPAPFFVIATQNPSTQAGTFPLPESQMDRFLMRIELGYPEPAAERELLLGGDRRVLLEQLQPTINLDQLNVIQNAVDNIKISDPLVDYVQRLVAFSRHGNEFAFGLSPRGALAMLQGAKAWALICDRTHVVPEDVQVVLPSIVEHRLRESADYAGHGGGALAQKLLGSVDVVS
ncbi:MAG: AAA domain-containing protein [Gammaproteobacteria bacterium]|nr:AAA domain-containing protein [Gammaproteobacteria bacterium]